MDVSRPVVVGVDGSGASLAAVRWAARHAAATGTQIQLIHAVHPLRATAATVPVTAAPLFNADELADAAQAVVTTAADMVHAEADGVTTTIATPPGNAARILVNASTNASLIVVGSRGLGGAAGLLLGSVSAHVATHGRCPTVVVHGDGRPSNGPIVVGVDGSATADAALPFAILQASRRRLSVVAVHAVTPPPAPPSLGEALATLAKAAHTTAETREAAGQMLDRVLAPWRAAFPGVDIHTQVLTASAAEALLEAAGEAALIVVGSRGHGALRGLLLGSTSRTVLHDAPCPVVVTRTDRAAEGSPPAQPRDATPTGQR